MPQFVALTSKGLGPALRSELVELGLKCGRNNKTTVPFQASWEKINKQLPWLKIASRVLRPISEFSAYKAEDLYFNVKKHDFTPLLKKGQTLAVDASLRGTVFNHSHFVAQKVKDAVVDQYQEKFGWRPSVDAENPDLLILVKVNKEAVEVSLDVNGESLARRGYRKKTTVAPLRENLAAGLLRLAEYSPEAFLLDPMCGSGTWSLEACLWKQGIHRKQGLLRWQTMQELSSPVVSQTSHEGRIESSDLKGFALQAAKINAESFNIFKEKLHFKQQDFFTMKAPEKNKSQRGLIVLNPPYGERMSEKKELVGFYKKLGEKLRGEFAGWEAWILSGDEELSQHLGLKAKEKHQVWNGALECRWLCYPLG